MNATVDVLFEEALMLGDSQRMELVERLIPTVDDDLDIQVEQLAEVRRRVEEVRSGRVKTIPGEIVFREVRESLAAAKTA